MTIRGSAWIAAAALALAGCQSQWYLQNESSDRLTTDVVISSTPDGADLRWNDVAIGKAPLKLPVEYDYVEELWTRQTNVGARLREDWGTVGTILGFIVWIPASFIHETEDRRRHRYGHNEFEVTARLPGYADAYRKVKIEGEDEIEVRMTLVPRCSILWWLRHHPLASLGVLGSREGRHVLARASRPMRGASGGRHHRLLGCHALVP